MSDATPTTSTLLWPDLSAHGVSLGIVAHDANNSSLIFVDPAGKHSNVAKNMGFQKTKWPGLWTRSDTRVEASAFRAAFPNVSVVKKTLQSIQEEAILKIEGIVSSSRQQLLPGFDAVGAVDENKEPEARLAPSAPRKAKGPTIGGEEIDISPLIAEARLFGYNSTGEEVFESPDGNRFVRFSVDTDEGTVDTVEKEKARLSADDATAGRFLRGITEGSLSIAADGFVRSMAEGHTARVDELQRFFRAVTEREFTQGDPDLNRVIGAIDRSRVRKLAQLVVSPDNEAFSAALRLHEAAQYYTLVKDHRMTPLPIGVALQQIAGAMPENSTVRIDNAQYGEFSSFSEGVSRFAKSTGDQPSDLLLGAYNGQLLDQSIQAFGTSVSRNDHANVLQSLSKMAPSGLGIFVIEGDTAPGRIGPSSRRFMDALANLHEIEGIVDIDGSLMGVPGSPPSRMIVVGNRRETPGHGGLPPAVPYVTDYPSLWSWSGKITNAIRKPGSVSYVDRGGVSKDTVIGENAFQAPYIPASLLSDPSLMVPRNLASPLRRAMIEINKDVPHIDPWLETQLQYSPGAMKEAISAEQGDAIAMGLNRVKDGLGFMVADQTGIGKGRIIAQLARAAVIRGEPVLFLTEKAELFTDLWRDIEDTNSEDFFRRIMILNDGEQIVSTKTGQVVASSASKEDVDTVMRSMKMPENIDIVFATYSQFNRDPVKAIRNHSKIDIDAMTASTLSASARERLEWVGRLRKRDGKKELKPVLVESVDIMSDPSLIQAMPLAAVKSLWIGKATKDTLLIMDESHNASGESSQTNLNFDHAVRLAKNVVYSSATFARGEANMRVYRRLFPSSVDVEALHQTLKKGGEALQEALSSMLAEDGAMIRREHDLSMIKFVPKIDLARQKKNEKYTDQLAEILAAMTYLTRETRQLTDSLTDAIRAPMIALNVSNLQNNLPAAYTRDQIDAVGIAKRGAIGNSLYTIMRSFLAVLKTDLAGDEAITAIKEGRKPVLVIDHTMEAELNRRLDEARERGQTLDTPGGIVFKAPGFRSILRDRLEGLSHASLDGNDLDLKQKPEFVAVIRQIEKLIDAFPDFPTSPIDSVRKRIEDEGFSVSELSGRKRRLVYDEKGGCTVVNIPTKERKRAKDEFNNGGANAIILTRAGNAGISLHDSHRFLNRGQRELIEVEVPEDVIARVQFFGRVNRNGQVSYPLIKTLSSGIPAENRSLALQNNKLRRMSANITANRDNSAITRDVADVLNVVGNEVAYRLLELDPMLAEKLDITLADRLQVMADGEEVVQKISGDKYVSELMNRLVVIPVAQQKKIIEEMTVEFNALVEELDSIGENPLKAKFYDVNAKTIDSDILESSLTTPVEGQRISTFDRHVNISTIEYEAVFDPMSSKDLLKHVKSGQAEQNSFVDDNFGTDEKYKEWRLENPSAPFMDHVIDRLADEKTSFLSKYIGKHPSVADALAHGESNMVKKMDEKIDHLATHLSLMKVGSVVLSYNENSGSNEKCVVVGLKPPKPTEIHYAARYKVKLATMGDKKLITKSLSSMLEKGTRVLKIDLDDDTLKDFGSSKRKSYTVQRPVLDGNLFRSAEMSLQTGLGTQAYFSDENGLSNRAVVLPLHCKAKDFRALPLRIHDKELAKDFYNDVLAGDLYSTAAAGRDKESYRKVSRKGICVEKTETEILISIPGNRQWIDWLRSHPELMNVTGPFGGSRDKIYSTVPNRMMGELVDALYATGVTLYAHSDARAKISKDHKEDISPRDWFAKKLGSATLDMKSTVELGVPKDQFSKAIDSGGRSAMRRSA